MIAALKSKDSTRAGLLRQLQAELVTFEKSTNGPTSLGNSDEVKVIRKCADKWSKAIKEYEGLLVNSNRKEDLQKAIDKEQGELEIIKSYLPQSYNQDELRQAVNEVMAKLSIERPAPTKLGLVMKELLATLDSSKIESSKDLSILVKTSLS